jgi:diguanylate cyclase (GGDEF)-like protein
MPFFAMLLGVVLLAAGLMATAVAFAQERKQQTGLQRDAAQVSASFSSYFERARSLNLLLAQNQTFAVATQGSVNREAANRALSYLEVLYPGAIGEACLIADHGHEIARVTHGQSSDVAHLSMNEAANPFFGPTLRLRPNEVYQAAPYVSPDTHNWVISNSTWIRLADNSRLIVHFEVSLASFGQYLGDRMGSRHVAVIHGRSGEVILQDHNALPTATPPGRFPITDWSTAYATQSTASSVPRIDNAHGVFKRIARTEGNANDWYVAEWDTARASFLPSWVGIGGAALGVVLIGAALWVLRHQQNAFRAAARLDHLTGLANRKALEEALDDALDGETSPTRDRVAVLMLDLDGFKQINDALGHDKGDLVLQEVALRLHANVLEFDTAARLGGDEFAVVLRQLRQAEDVAVVAHRLRDALIRPIEIDGVPLFVGVSIGASIHPEHGNVSSELLRNADAAMYQAKRGRDGVRVYAAGSAAGITLQCLAAELQNAIDHDNIELAFQPQFSVVTGEATGVEALARWNRPGHGPVPPVEFIQLAEDTGLIRSLTYLTLRLALDEARIWRRNDIHIPISVNLSGHMVSDGSLPGEVRALLEQRGLDGSALVLEITETAVIGNKASAAKVLQRLRSNGIRVELDDFGSGYASFGTLHGLPLDGVKIDQGLISDQAQGDTRLLAATIEMARRLGLTIIAEGVEDVDTLKLISELGCDVAQGYHMARPMTPESLRLLLGCEPSAKVTTPPGVASREPHLALNSTIDKVSAPDTPRPNDLGAIARR